MDARQVLTTIEGRSVPGRLGRHRVVISPAIDFLAFGDLGWAYKPVWGFLRISSHTAPFRAAQNHTEPFRAIYQAIMCDISPSTVFSRRRSFPLLRASIIDHRRRFLPAVLSSFPSTTAPSPSLSKMSQAQEITTDAKYRGICHIAQRRARNCGSRRDKWWCSLAGIGYFGCLLPDGYAAR